ncbi:hypothetical protein GCM10010423_69250 [Streptomyces levis]|uniref:ANTAR domain-containing protein n=1 Tax=Streptomyces levis TaxID=285566 RepID=A0ABN3P206_9ACTN
MTIRPAQRPLPGVEALADDKVARLERENAELRHAVDAHATVDQALGVLLAVYRLTPSIGFDVLREVSQRTNTKLRAIAQNVIDWALGTPLPEVVGRELDAAVERAWRAAEEYRRE